MLSCLDLWNHEHCFRLNAVPDGSFSLSFLDDSHGSEALIRNVAPFFCRITDIELDLHSLDLFNFLTFPGASELPLQRLSLSVDELRSVTRLGMGSNRRTSIISCPHLTIFSINVRRPVYGLSLNFSNLDLPAVATFILVGGGNQALRFADFQPLLERSGPSIRSLRLSNVQIDQSYLSNEISDTLGKLPSLEHLTLEGIPTALKGLMDSSTHAIHPLPNLQTLALDVDCDHSGDFKTAVAKLEVLMSTLMAQPARRTALEKITFIVFYPPRPPTAFQRAALAVEKLQNRLLDLYGATNESRGLEVFMKTFEQSEDESSDSDLSNYYDEDDDDDDDEDEGQSEDDDWF
ncbi:hypothetical protein H0H93_009145 [Arthromyces matolae]|nr:hypothetical protein H0H93_009145 [Arthromyces matolae]